ncbi:glycerophosphodiester phosphodiesterase family protein [Subtercola frigoramans]|uniref:glycerophosphodiester phosphodiesterase n=1 Tax=Subtercola frigoramans TaxID=120298 RepID=A0ABS2L320_9MICO|nr:glycerophosphodiester phosphodiesterase family protein [Subtercola frigoramans]MBM7471409.1 glycerophosphoryl diester phosphodiesterase [Subtercola frigoramans]
MSERLGFPYPLVIGHRGACGYRPEHSAAAYLLAFDLGADFVEPDIVVTRDGQLVLRHENEISGTTDVAEHPEFAHLLTSKVVDGVVYDGWFTEDLSWAELSTLRCTERLPGLRPQSAQFDGQFGILRLADLFSLVDEAGDASQRPLGIVAELKHSSYFSGLGFSLAQLFADEVRNAGWGDSQGRLIVESFEPTCLAELRSSGAQCSRVLLIEAEGSPPDLLAAAGDEAPEYASYLTMEGLRQLADDQSIDGISVPKQVVLSDDGRRLVQEAHHQRLAVYTWTLRPENMFLSETFRAGAEPTAFGDWAGEFEAILAAGVDGVFADHPDLAVSARTARPR